MLRAPARVAPPPVARAPAWIKPQTTLRELPPKRPPGYALAQGAKRNVAGRTPAQQVYINKVAPGGQVPVSGEFPHGVPMEFGPAYTGRSRFSLNRPPDPTAATPAANKWWPQVARQPAIQVTPAGTSAATPGTAPLIGRAEAALTPSRYPLAAYTQAQPGAGQTLIPYRESLARQVERYIYENLKG